jgi:hypothetical protein
MKRAGVSIAGRTRGVYYLPRAPPTHCSASDPILKVWQVIVPSAPCTNSRRRKPWTWQFWGSVIGFTGFLLPNPCTVSDLTPSASTYQNYIRERQMKFNERGPRTQRLFELLLRTCYENFDAIECATDPKVFLYPCRGDPRSMHCQNYGFRFRQLATAVFCDNCGQREL